MSRLTVNLVTWNGERYIEDCLHSIMQQTFKDYSIIIIDNGSTDQTLDLIKERFPQLKVIKHKDNLGFSKAHNQAIHWTKSEYVLCLNQDIVLDPDCFEKLVDFMDRYSLVGSVTPKMYRLQEGERTKYIDSLGIKLYKNYNVSEIASGVLDEGQFGVKEEVFGVSGAMPMYRRKALEEIIYQQEYFDEDFFSYKEDIDLAFRLRLAGWQSWVVPEAVAYHDRTTFIAQDKPGKIQIFKNRRRKSKFANYHSYRNHLYFLVKNLPKLTFRIVFYELIKLGYVLVFEIRSVRAWKELLKNKKTLLSKRKVIWKNKKIKDEELKKWLS